MDQDGNVLDILVQSRRDKKAAKKFFRKLLKGCQYAHGSSSRISRTVMGLPSGRCSQGGDTANIDISTTARRTPTNPPASGSGACRGSSRQGTPNASSPRLVRSPTTFDRDGIACRLQPTGKSCGADSIPGRNPATPPQLCIKSQTKGRSTPSCPRIMLIGNKLAIA